MSFHASSTLTAIFQKVMAVWPFGLLIRWFGYLGGELRWLLQSVGGKQRLVEKHVRILLSFKLEIERWKPPWELSQHSNLGASEFWSRTSITKMNDSHFHLDAGEILQIDEHGIKTGDSKHDLDVIIYATGSNQGELWLGLGPQQNPERRMGEGHAWHQCGTFHKGLPNTFLGRWLHLAAIV